MDIRRSIAIFSYNMKRSWRTRILKIKAWHKNRVARHGARIRLTEDEFFRLVSGKVVKQDGVAIILADIGFYRMSARINEAIRNSRDGRTSKTD